MNWPWNRRRDRELDEELRTHLRMAVEERVARGERRPDAELAARREFGNLGVVQEVTRETWGGNWLERLAQDVRYGARTLRRSPVFTGVAGATLALGIGATTAMFTVVHAVVLRPLPYPRADRLMQVSYWDRSSPFVRAPGLPDYYWVEVIRRQRSFGGLAASISGLVSLVDGGDPVRLQAATVTPQLFSTLGVGATYGRTFVADEAVEGRNRVVVLGADVWRDRFGADPGIVGRSVTLDGVRHTVVGVMPPGFSFPDNAQLWRPFEVRLRPHLSQLLSVTGRLRDGVTPDRAAAELASIALGVGKPENVQRQDVESRVVPLKDVVVGGSERLLFVFAGAVALVLLIACANVANLLLMRAAGRQREMAVRAALGAGRRRLVRQLVTESALLWVIAGLVGVGVAVVGVRALLTLAPAGRIPRHDEIGVDAAALAFALSVSLATGVLFGLVPAIRATRGAVRDALAATSRTMSGRDGPLRGMLVVAEIALALVLLAGAGLMVQSFVRMRDVELGFRPSGLATMTVDLPEATYASATVMREFHDRMLERLRQIPGAAEVAAVNFLPLGHEVTRGDFKLEGGRSLPKGYIVAKPGVSPGYFQTMGIRLIAGREFTVADAATAPKVAILSRSVAAQFWSITSAVGQRISMKDDPGPNDWITVIGVVDDVTQEDRKWARDPAIYQPYAQLTQPFFLGHMTFVIRATAEPELLVPPMRQAMREVDRAQPIGAIGTMDATLSATVAEPLFQARLIGVFSAFALLLAGIGIYGVVAYSVAERTHEIGIRVALGAARGDVVGMVLRRIIALVLPGVVIGIAGALAVTRVLATLLFAVKPNDPATFTAVALILVAVALIAGLVPARRASRVDPLIALRAGG